MTATLLVTGTGANIGYGAVRLFKQIQGVRVIATDIYEDAVGQHWADRFYQVPLTSDAHYKEAILRIVEAEKINMIVPCIEPDVFYYNVHRSEWEALGVTLALNEHNLINLCKDKWVFQKSLERECSELAIPSLSSINLPALKACLGLPFIVKPKRGHASKDQHIVHNENEFALVKSLLNDTHLAQHYIADDTEFTVAFYGDGKGGNCATIQMQRALSKEGATKAALVVHREDLEMAVEILCQAYKPTGPTNAQFRLLNEKPVLLEINPRLSSSLSLRAAFGFNDCEMMLNHYINGNLPTQPNLKPGYGIRYTEDLIVPHRDHI